MPSDGVCPPVGGAHGVPDERLLGLRVAAAIDREMGSEVVFQRRVPSGVFGVHPMKVAEQQRELLREGARPADMDVGSPSAGLLPEVALRALGVVLTPNVAGPDQRRPDRLDRVQLGDRDLDVDDWFGRPVPALRSIRCDRCAGPRDLALVKVWRRASRTAPAILGRTQRWRAANDWSRISIEDDVGMSWRDIDKIWQYPWHSAGSWAAARSASSVKCSRVRRKSAMRASTSRSRSSRSAATCWQAGSPVSAMAKT